MSNDLREMSRNDLRRVLGEMESLAPLAPELDTAVVGHSIPGQTRPHPFLVALGAAVAVFALALPIILLTATPTTEQTGESVPSSAMTATSSPDTTPTTAPSPGGWWIDDIPMGAVLTSVDQGFVSVANENLTNSEVRTSEDGMVWETSGSLGEGAVPMDVEWNGGILVVVGAIVTDATDAEGEIEGRTHTPAIWTSADRGAKWTRVELGASDVTATPDGFAAVGIERDDSDPDYIKTQGVLWTSPDGATWTETARSDDPEGVSSNFRNVVWDQQLLILGRRGPHSVTEGSGLEDSDPHDNVTWFSDGASLSDPSPSSLTGHLDPDSTAVTPHGIIATTHWSTPTVKTEAAAWISQDGTNWTMLDIEPGSYEYTDIVSIGDEVLITGYEIVDTGGDGIDTGVWSSMDGATWTRIALPGLPEFTKLQQVVASESAIVIAGDQSSTGVIAGRPRP